MEYTGLYNTALELEGLILILKNSNPSEEKRSEICRLIVEKATLIKQSFVSGNQPIASENATTLVAVCPSTASQDITEENNIEPTGESTSLNDSLNDVTTSESDTEAIADNALFEEEEDADDDQHQPAVVTSPKSEYSVSNNVAKTEDIGNDNNVTIDVNLTAFAHKAKGDIRKYFTLNDNYKFRRELFGNSNDRYVAALSYIEGLPSLQSARDYCLNILGWDSEQEEVNDFLNIISAYFIK